MKPVISLSVAILAILLASISAPEFVHGRPEFRDRLPNAKNVDGYLSIGHVAHEGGGPLNPFGMAFKANGLKWSTALCQMDSDGDGQTNGQELGDPCCEWVMTTNEKTRWTNGVSAPGDPASKSNATLWAGVACANATSSATGGGSESAGGSGGAGAANNAATTSAPAVGTPGPATTTPTTGASTRPTLGLPLTLVVVGATAHELWHV